MNFAVRFHIVILLASVLILSGPTYSYAQNVLYSNSYLPDSGHLESLETVAFAFNNTPLREALAEFTERTGIILVYSMDKEQLNRPVTTTIFLESPISALQKILSRTGLEIMLSSSGRIVLIPRIGEYEEVNGGVTGKVVDYHTGNPVPRANIFVEELQLGTVTNDEGRFTLQDVPSGRYTLRASHVAYETAEQEVKITPDDPINEDILLNPAIFNLGEIFVDDSGQFLHSGGISISGATLNQNEISEPGRTGVGQVLRTRVAGVTFFEYGSVSGSGHLQFRGVGSVYNPTDYVRINVDGIPVDGIFWETFITDNLSRIEILRGPQASGQYGANAMSGVINLYTDTGKEGSVGAGVSAAGGLAKSSASDFDPLWQEYFGSIGGGSDVITSGITIRHTRDEGVLVNRESRMSAVTAGTQITPTEKFSVRGAFRFSDLNSGWPYSQNIQSPTDITLMQPDVSSRQQRGIGSVNMDLNLFSWWKQRFTVGSEYMHGVMEYETSELVALSGENRTTQKKVSMRERDMHIRPTVHYNSKFIIPMGETEHATFSGGIEVQREDRERDVRREIESNVFEQISSGSSEQTIIGKYLSWSFHSDENLDVTVGFRMDQIRAEGKTFNYPMSPSLNVGYRFQVADYWLGIVRGSVGRGIRHPHYSMIFGRPPVEEPNPDLSAEIMDGWEAGLSNYLADGRLLFSSTFFSQETHDAFQAVPVQNDRNAYRWVNSGRVTNRGLEIEAQVIPTQWLQLGISHIFHWNRAIDLRQEDPHEFTLLRIPDIAGSFFFAIQPQSNINLNFDIYYVGERLDVDIEEWHNDGRSRQFGDYEKMFSPYMKVDFFGRYLILNEHELFLNIYNIFNDMTREYGGMPPAGRMIIFGMRYNL